MDEETARIIGRMQRELETLRAIEISPIANSGWVATSVTWTYASASTFTVAGDVTATYQKGTFLRWKQGGGWKYGVVASSAYAAPNTTVTTFVNNDYTVANAAITDPWYSYAANPQGFPQWFNISAPSYDLTTIDNGTGGQPVTADADVRIANGTCKIEIILATTNVYKVSNGILINFTLPGGLPAIQNATYSVVGVVSFGGINYVGVIVYTGGSNFACVSAASIADNAAIPATAIIVEYRI